MFGIARTPVENPTREFRWDFVTELRARRLAADRPTFGVCFGAQMIAAALGSRVYAGPVKEIGFHPIAVHDDVPDNPLHGLAEELPQNLVLNHQSIVGGNLINEVKFGLNLPQTSAKAFGPAGYDPVGVSLSGAFTSSSVPAVAGSAARAKTAPSAEALMVRFMDRLLRLDEWRRARWTEETFSHPRPRRRGIVEPLPLPIPLRRPTARGADRIALGSPPIRPIGGSSHDEGDDGSSACFPQIAQSARDRSVPSLRKRHSTPK